MNFRQIGIDNSSNGEAGTDRSFGRLPRFAGWHYPRLLWRVLPTGIKDMLRELRVRILSPYLVRDLPRHNQFEQTPEDAMASESISIVVPVHDAPEVTWRCLVSLQRYAARAEVIVVDDASKLEATKKLLEDFAGRNHWRMIRHVATMGHSAACNAGSAVATRPYLCLLNSDTVVTPECWRPIIRVFEENPSIGVAGPSTSDSGNSQTQPRVHFARRYMNDSQICAYASRLAADYPHAGFSDLRWVSGFALFIRRELWEKIGGFDRNLPDYGNDVELCRRSLEEGNRVVWVGSSYIHHLGGISYGKSIGVEAIFARAKAAEEYLGKREDGYER